MKSDRCPDDKMSLARRGAGDAATWESISEHVETCEDCRVAWCLAGDFDRNAPMQPGDERLLWRAARATTRPARRPWRAERMAMVAAGLILAIGAVAGAAEAIRQRIVRLRIPPAAHDADASAAAGVRRPRRIAAAPGDDPALAGAAAIPIAPNLSEVALPPPVPAHRLSQVAATVEGPAAPPADAAVSLFLRATAARGQGRSAEAIAIFVQLQRAFPDSAEATVSLVSMGMLWEAAQPRQALDAFDRYLRRAPAGTLAPEARAGRVRIIERMGVGSGATVDGRAR